MGKMKTENSKETDIERNKDNVLYELIKNKAIYSLAIGDFKISGAELIKLWEENNNLGG